jgi:enterochelin esterase family protein
MNFGRITARAAAVLLMAAAFVFSASAQSAAPANQPTPAPVVVSPEVSADRQITFRLLAPQAENVRLIGSDIPGVGSGKPMTKGDNGVWEITIGQIASGSYR